VPAKSNEPFGNASPYSPVQASSTSTAVRAGMYWAIGAEPTTDAGYQRLIISSRRPLGMVGCGRDRSIRWTAAVPSAFRPVGAGTRNVTGWKSGSNGAACAEPGAATARPTASPPVNTRRLVTM
jgi:hypothetical protein